MEYNEKKQTLTIYGKEEKISTLARKFASLSGRQAYDFFSNRQIGLPRAINCLAFYSVLNERLKTLTAAEVSKDQAVRLQSYDCFSEVELYDLFASLCANKEAYRQYRINLFTIILVNYANLKLTDGEITYLTNVTKSPIEKVNIYVQYITSASYEMVNTFDGQDIEKLIGGFNKSAVISDIINLAEKYGIELKQKFTKDELVEEVKNYLKISDSYTLDLESEIDNATISDLNLFCSKRNIPLSSSMNKDNLIKYFFFILEHAEIPTTEVTNIEIPKEFEPLEFKVDLSAYKGFKNEVTDPTKQIILWAGAEKQAEVEAPTEEAIVETPAEEPVQAEEAEPQEEPSEEPFEEEQLEEASDIAEEVTDEEVTEEAEDVLYVDEDGNPVNPEDVEEIIEEEPAQTEEALGEAQEDSPAEEAVQAEVVEEIQEEPQTEEETEVEEPKVEEETEEQKEAKKQEEKQKKEKLALSFGNVEENSFYGDEKLYKALKPPVKLIASIIGITLVAAAVIILIIAYMPH